jgi:hypothetical protein
MGDQTQVFITHKGKKKKVFLSDRSLPDSWLSTSPGCLCPLWWGRCQLAICPVAPVRINEGWGWDGGGGWLETV